MIIMKKSKKTLFEALILLNISLFLLLGAFIGIQLYLLCYPHKSVSLKLLIILFIALYITAFITFVQILRSVQFYIQLCQNFTDGKIYQDFVTSSDLLFPGLHNAILRFDSLLDRQQVLQLSQKQAEFLALQNQINPHFLYNTLESIRGDALAAGMDNIADITEALSTFFRYTITETQNLVSLQEELDNVDNYFAIQKYRFGDKLLIQLDIRDDSSRILHLQCPKLFLQPIVENAIFHGLEKKKGCGIIIIRIELIDAEVHIEVSDNGIGMNEETLFALNQSLDRVSIGAIVEDQEKNKTGIALKNVCRRIKLLFGEQYGIHINSILGIGTNIEITLPIIEMSKHYEK